MIEEIFVWNFSLKLHLSKCSVVIVIGLIKSLNKPRTAGSRLHRQIWSRAATNASYQSKTLCPAWGMTNCMPAVLLQIRIASRCCSSIIITNLKIIHQSFQTFWTVESNVQNIRHGDGFDNGNIWSKVQLLQFETSSHYVLQPSQYNHPFQQI